MNPYQDILNKVAELSMKLNKMESDLREFEKQRVNPKFEEMRRIDGILRNLIDKNYTDLKEVISSHDCRINNVFERIEILDELKEIE